MPPRSTLTPAAHTALSRWASPDTPLLAAVSGGADSVALAAALAGQSEFPLLGVAFVDHGLRDVAAERAAAQAAADRAEVPFFALAVTLSPGNLQAAARLARYRALITCARDLDPRTLVATAHTQTDQAETVLARLLRGSGVPGLAAIAPRCGRVIRPLLAVSRAETRALGLPFVDDPSNATPRFQRNRLRAILTALAPEAPHLEATLAALAGHARASTALLDALALATIDLPPTTLTRELLETWLLHRARVSQAELPSRGALATWARAIAADAPATVSLGDGLAGRSDTHASIWIESDEDPRRRLVAWEFGSYRTPSMELTVQPSLRHNPEKPSDYAWFNAYPGPPAWPITLRPARPGEAGWLSTGIDLGSGAPRGGWCVTDGARRLLKPVDLQGPALNRRESAAWATVGVRTLLGDDHKQL